jgi:hypothetical protein
LRTGWAASTSKAMYCSLTCAWLTGPIRKC